MLPLCLCFVLNKCLLFKVHLYTARTRTRPTRTRTRLLSGFAIQIEHEPKHRKPLTDFEAARHLLVWDIKFGHLESWRRYN